MASSRNSAPAEEPGHDEVRAAVASTLAAFVAPGARVAVALSGGMDSMVLLDVLARLPTMFSLRVSAIHVHHGISPNADRWARFCADQCAARGIALVVHELSLEHGRPSLEAAAREARYECLLASDADAVALAHHADDQAETVLLQLLRGAGPRGLSAMPLFREGRPALLRPLLSLPRKLLAEYARSRGLSWIEDESNADARHKRNALRNEIVPLMAAHFGGYPGTIARAARHQASAGALLDELAALDAASALDADGFDRSILETLAPARAGNVLRWFLRREGLRAPSEARLAELLRQLAVSAADARVRLTHDGAEIGIHRGRVVVHAPPPQPFARRWQGEARMNLPAGVLLFERVEAGGLAEAKIVRAPVTVRSRVGGERMRLAMNRPRRSVKKLLQEARLSQWQRQALPLVWCGDELAAIPGIGVDLAFQADVGEPAWNLAWLPFERAAAPIDDRT